MSAKKKTGSKAYRCSSCGYTQPRWLGRCPDCGEWNTFEETQMHDSPAPRVPGASGATASRPVPLSAVEARD
ncbi:MAG: DNA repair protein RadA, partial [Spirochaetales bacterium]|nr:DNA repair protein RadA [Spirochaetales bacterium]